MVVSQQRVFAPRLLFKITLPYVALALVLALATIYVVARGQAIRFTDEFSQQINDSLARIGDSIVRTEQSQVSNVRTLARLSGLAQAAQAGDERALQDLIVPYAVSQNIERIAVVDMRGRPLIAIRGDGATVRSDGPKPDTARWPDVAAVLRQSNDARGDKYVALLDDAGDQVLYTIAPIYAGQDQVGALLVGTTARTLVGRWREAILADVTLYGADGAPLATSFGADMPTVFEGAPGERPLYRELTLGSRDYGEVITPLVLRGSPQSQFIGVALSTAGQQGVLDQGELRLLPIFGAGILAAFALGIVLSRRITRPIRALVKAAEGVAAGDLNRALPVTTGDEIGALTSSFNTMISGLRERERMHDILGRFVSPTVARLVLSHPLDLSGENKLLTILFTDLRDFTVLSEREEPAVVINGLNAYFQIVVDAADRHGGIVNKFGGDSTLVLFGLADERSDARASAEAAVRAALEIREGLRELNAHRMEQQLPPLDAGIGINTGTVVAGLIGTERRMEYTAIGDAVNLSSRIQALNREIGSDLLISEATYTALGEPGELGVVDYGFQRLKGKSYAVRVYGITGWEASYGA